MSRLTAPGGAFFRTSRPLTIAAATALAYYGGAMAGLALRLPVATPSVVWPPNAILTAILLFVPLSRWWAVLLGAAGAHFATELRVFPPALVSALFLTNCSEALIAAGGLRAVSDEPSQFNTLRRVALFIVFCGLTAPFLSSFLDAGVVRLLAGEDYWTVWRIRFPSNVLAQLTIVPAIAGFLNDVGRVQMSRRRSIDVTAIAGGLLLVTIVVSLDAGQIGILRAPLAIFIPVLLYAAVRFGAPAVGLAVLAALVLAVEAEAQGLGTLLRAARPEDRIGTLQMFFIAASVPMLCVGALVDERQKAVTALQLSDLLKSSVLDAISSVVVVLARDGHVIAVNQTSARTARQFGMPGVSADAGGQYLESWRTEASRGSSAAADVHKAITRVLDRSAATASLEYSRPAPGGDRWWFMSAVPLGGPDGGAVVTHTDMTVQKRAEIEAQRSRDELAHVARVWVMGELTASLSHQLNQPLASIMGNAQAGLRFLGMNPPNLAELRSIFQDVAADADRAAGVTRTVRDMLRKETSGHQPLDLNEVVRDTATLVASQCSMHNVSMQLALAPSLPLVPGERVQLRQVMLNLMMNAIEAVSDQRASEPKRVAIRTEGHDANGIRVSVLDNGSGLTPGAEEQVFEPLFTTKTSGMGMGLPIARAIVEAHGGAIWARNTPEGGAIFHFTLPGSVEAEAAVSISAAV